MTSKIKNQIGKYLTLYLREMNVATVTPDGENLHISAMIEGFLVDVDDIYLYLGDDKNKFNRLVRHDVVGILELSDQAPKAPMIVPPTIMGDMGDDSCH